MVMRFAIWNHSGKSDHLASAMLDAGHEPVADPATADLLLIDTDWPWAGTRPQVIAAAAEAGTKVVIYPHGGFTTCFVYDGLAEPDPNVAMRLEHGPGALEVARHFDPDGALRQEVVGWLYNFTHEFTPVKAPKRVLFAPMHPMIEPLLKGIKANDPAPALNRAVYNALLAGGYDLTVSVVAPLHANGVWPHPRAKIVPNPGMQFAQTLIQILAADVVVAEGTVAATAVSVGKPTVMFAQGLLSDLVNGELQPAHHRDDYLDFCRYPLDVGDGPLDDLIGEACRGHAGVQAWRDLFVGPAGGAKTAVAKLEALVAEQSLVAA